LTSSSPEDTTTRTEEADDIRVLLVDDNEQWAQYIKGELENRTEGLEVSTAFTANEAVTNLHEKDSYDCVVADYHMPEADGIQLLQTVRDENPDLPFILVTGEGSENVASQAIEEDVTDYIKKDPRDNQIGLFANRIEKAVEQYRLHQRIEESEERYRTVTEQTQEAVAIIQDDRLVFCNERLSEITGIDREKLLSASDLFDELVHPEDSEEVKSTVNEWRRGDTQGGLYTARLMTEDGKTRHCEYTGRRINYTGKPATLVSFRDVTRREKRRRRRRRRQDLNKRVQETLVESRTRDELEESVAEHLREYGYDLVWVGDVSEEGLTARVTKGNDEYLEEFGSVVDVQGSSEPRLSASQTEEPRFVEDLQDLFSADWSELAVEFGYRSCVALPLVHEGVSYGVLAVYGRDADGIDEGDKEVLEATADVLALSIHSLETKKALTTDIPVEVELEIYDSDYYLSSVLSSPRFDVSSAEVSVTGTHPHTDDEVVQYVRLTEVGLEEFKDAVDDEPAIEELSLITDDGEGETRVQVTVSERTPESQLASMGAVVRSTTVTPNGSELVAELPGRENLGSVVDALEERHGKVSVLSCVEADSVSEAGSGFLIDSLDLTDKQEVALEAAHHHGYFEQPREASASEIAESLDVTHSTYLQHLRIAQKRVFENLYD